jgi:hypothetical protein
MNTPLAIATGRLHRQKGFDIAVRALTHQSDDSMLLICGDGPAERSLMKATTALGLSDRVLFMGRLDKRQLRAVMSASDVLLFPTRRREGLPMTILEGLANGLPVVTVRNARVPDNLMKMVTITARAPRSIARAWNIEAQRPTVSGLDQEYDASRATARYFDAVRRIVEATSMSPFRTPPPQGRHKKDDES